MELWQFYSNRRRMEGDNHLSPSTHHKEDSVTVWRRKRRRRREMGRRGPAFEATSIAQAHVEPPFLKKMARP